MLSLIILLRSRSISACPPFFSYERALSKRAIFYCSFLLLPDSPEDIDTLDPSSISLTLLKSEDDESLKLEVSLSDSHDDSVMVLFSSTSESESNSLAFNI